MATLSNPRIKIVETLPDRSCQVSVTCNVNFTLFDINSMKLGLTYRLNCSLMGDDPGANDPTIRPNFGTKTFTGANIPATQVATFPLTIPSSGLDEDAGSDADEVFAKLTLINMEPPTTLVFQTQTSNIVHHFEA